MQRMAFRNGYLIIVGSTDSPLIRVWLQHRFSIQISRTYGMDLIRDLQCELCSRFDQAIRNIFYGPPYNYTWTIYLDTELL